jgi:Mlc titration factor MtfA (ptsG expression regulator)
VNFCFCSGRQPSTVNSQPIFMLTFLLILAIALGAALWFVAAPILRARRRTQWARLPIAPASREWLQRHMPFYSRIPAELRDRLQALVQIFVREKSYVGCNGLIVTEEMRVVIAGYACLLVLNRPGVPRAHFYDDLLSILVYPTAFIVHESEEENGIVTEGHSVLSGQAWDSRRIILSWEDVADGVAEHVNVVLHEFAHYLDMEDETMDGAPGLGSAADYEQWSRTFREEYDRLAREVDEGRETLLDAYAVTEPAEFFAVATETFFHQPRELQAQHAKLYEQLMRYYRLDPASWSAACG